MALDDKHEAGARVFKIVGTRPIRPDGIDKVTGEDVRQIARRTLHRDGANLVALGPDNGLPLSQDDLDF